MLPDLNTLDLIEEYLRYNTLTGLITYKKSDSRHRAGDIAGIVTEDGYKRINIGGQSFPHHHVAVFLHTGDWPPSYLDVDHISRVRSDNRGSNLRVVDKGTNQKNRGLFKNNSSGYTGVYPRGNKFVAYLGHNKMNFYLGSFETIERAVEIRTAVMEALI